MNVSWILEQVTRRRWPGPDLAALGRTAGRIGVPRRSAMYSDGETLPGAEEERAMDYLALALVLRHLLPPEAAYLDRTCRRLECLLDRYVPEGRRGQVRAAVAAGARSVLDRLAADAGGRAAPGRDRAVTPRGRTVGPAPGTPSGAGRGP